MKVALVGVGGLGGALARGWLATGVAPSDLTLCDVDEQRARAQVEGAACAFHTSAGAAVRGADVVLLAVKPNDVAAALDQLGAQLDAHTTVISVAAGVTHKRLRSALGAHGQLVRAMPNVNVAVRHSVTALVAEPDADPSALERALDLFNRVGTTVVLADEKQLDPATALGASGPAWVALVLEALMDGGVKAGLPRAVAVQMALGMVEGTAAHLRHKGLHPGALKDMVTSPGGTTAAGQLVLEQGGVRGALMGAVDAATVRARELGG
jgi:pyrroline-5-carboxylate reductase